MQVEEINIILLRKSIRSIRLSVSPDGKVRLSIPHSLKAAEAHSFVVARLPWIHKHLERLNNQKILEPQDLSSVLFLGETRKTCLIFQAKRQHVFIDENGIIQFSLKPGTTPEEIQKILDKWYGKELNKLLIPLSKEWEVIMDVEVSSFKFRRMKTRWGSCNVLTHQIVLNTELAKKSFPCIEYILVHEMVHLLERGHGPKFKALMNKYLPHWKFLRKEINDKVIIL